MVRNQICLHQNQGKISKFGKREIPVCFIGTIKSKRGFVDFQQGWSRTKLGKTKCGTYKIQSGIEPQSTFGKIILNPCLENI